ncbi:MAG: hypothetical protein Q8764_02500 [Pigeon pea little leaf phytoplasma]|uniref:Uncharacterized protein n=1 Tax=Candidatus Phytoplasma fabacearum TaxID=2982628 RepID=A0ABU8ZTV1_9MOLU|nr:hypothetical protein ['Bituminaria bituminosa' little leaf phytoplasma]MDV3149039.1 hypothetical protein [Pigeon pea little leaf phytoplasma]MDO7983740.1 hypothetical protein ['Bituminaria bituminosa' little leaf phytoplasma]MDO8024127.1 hypothetical protein ['Bituminaria bituminosa' little leaf phytoplasma]MDO8030823.1 hypothetical protein ['Bituminaria bituminosa' little leaf phytoplasma]MDV3154294.1 hypothetical protein [Pigeon pea little leaf phytoplasma]
MASRMLGNLPVRFRWRLFVIAIRKINSEIETQIIYPYYLLFKKFNFWNIIFY